MILVLVILACFSNIGKAFNFDYEPSDLRVYEIKHRTQEDEPTAPEPVVLETASPEPIGPTPVSTKQVARYPVATNPVVSESVAPDIKPVTTKDEAMNSSMCDDFIRYSKMCTGKAAEIYNSTRKTPPDPLKVQDWCKAIRQLTTCAVDWNTECGAVNENRFDEDSIRGHKHVLDNFCDDECARTSFRRCTLDVLFATEACVHDEVLIVQKFSAIVSEGDVFQNCDFNMVYTNCSGGDPRPNKDLLTKLVAPDDSGTLERATLLLILSMLLLNLCAK